MVKDIIDYLEKNVNPNIHTTHGIKNRQERKCGKEKKSVVWPSRYKSGGKDKSGDEIYGTTQNISASSHHTIYVLFSVFNANIYK